MREQSRKVRQQIFEACSRILINEGLTNLTLDAVAEEAGISKGGLLYHFPNKNLLIDSLFEYHNNIFEERLMELAETEGDQPGAWLRAYAKASIEQILDPETAKLYASLFAAEERYASAHKLMREKYIYWQRGIESCGIDPTVATFVRLTVDGLWFSEMHHYAPPDIEHRNKILAFIMQITYNPELLEKVNSYK
jgi:AcrR family transcriptional regulator